LFNCRSVLGKIFDPQASIGGGEFGVLPGEPLVVEMDIGLWTPTNPFEDMGWAAPTRQAKQEEITFLM
jgi:hypothetical protein